MNVLVGVHEVVEAVLCLHDGVNPADIDAFDIEFEAARVNNVIADDDAEGYFEFRGRVLPPHAEPGDDEDAPYRRQHCIATSVERMLCALLGVSWNEYEQRVLALPPVKSQAST